MQTISQNITDEGLIVDYLAGNRGSLEELISRYLKPLYSFVFRYVGNQKDAEDIVQDVFLKTWKNLKRFDPAKKFQPWIFAIAKNTTVDFLKKKKTIPFSEFESETGENTILDNLADPAPLAPELLAQKDLGNAVNSALEKLSAKYRMVLFLRYNDHFTFEEIAESLGEPMNTVKSRHHRGLQLLKKVLETEKLI